MPGGTSSTTRRPVAPPATLLACQHSTGLHRNCVCYARRGTVGTCQACVLHVCTAYIPYLHGGDAAMATEPHTRGGRARGAGEQGTSIISRRRFDASNQPTSLAGQVLASPTHRPPTLSLSLPLISLSKGEHHEAAPQECVGGTAHHRTQNEDT